MWPCRRGKKPVYNWCPHGSARAAMAMAAMAVCHHSRNMASGRREPGQEATAPTNPPAASCGEGWREHGNTSLRWRVIRGAPWHGGVKYGTQCFEQYTFYIVSVYGRDKGCPVKCSPFPFVYSLGSVLRNTLLSPRKY